MPAEAIIGRVRPSHHDQMQNTRRNVGGAYRAGRRDFVSIDCDVRRVYRGFQITVCELDSPSSAAAVADEMSRQMGWEEAPVRVRKRRAQRARKR